VRGGEKSAIEVRRFFSGSFNEHMPWTQEGETEKVATLPSLSGGKKGAHPADGELTVNGQDANAKKSKGEGLPQTR